MIELLALKLNQAKSKDERIEILLDVIELATTLKDEALAEPIEVNYD